MSQDLVNYSAWELSEKIQKGELTKEDLYLFFKGRIEEYDPSINSFIETFNYEDIPAQTQHPLSGIPIAIKDNICINGREITCSSCILKGHISVYDATVIKKIKDAGLLLMGRTNMDEFAFGSSCETSCYGPTRNPWNTDFVPGGSSGGSAAAVGARFVPLALGSDTGGSIRQPASFCGVVGFKPTYGRVSRFGLVAFGSSLDQIGPITTNFIDCAYLLELICGRDENDSTSANIGTEKFSQYLVDKVDDLTIGIPKEYFVEGVDNEVIESVEKTIKFYRDRGAKIKNISLPHTEYAVATYYIIGTAEASSNLERFDGVKYGLRIHADTLRDLYKNTRATGFGIEAKRRIFLGTYSLSKGYYDAYYLRALKVRTLIKNDFMDAFRDIDVVLTPTSPTPAFKLGEKISDPLSMYLSDIFTISANLAGLPAVSFPCGFTKNNLPIGVQLIGRPFEEKTLIRMGYTFQCYTDYHKIVPELK